VFSVCREVFKAKHRKTGKHVALKKVLMENEKEGVRTCSSILRCTVDYVDVTRHPVFCCFSRQFPITALREIKILQLLKHENVVNLIEICRTKGVC